MAGVRNEALPSGKYQGWYFNYRGKRTFFVGTCRRMQTLRMAERIEDEHQQVKLGYRPVPKSADRHAKRPFSEVADEYLAWGESQGGRGGRPWSERHAAKRRSLIKWWERHLGLDALADLDGILSRAEKALRELQDTGRTGKTLQNYAEGLKSFGNWCVRRGYLAEDPLKDLVAFDTTPKTKRRAMTAEEIKKLLDVVPEHRRLLYEVALTSGLRAKELRSLSVDHLDVTGGGLRLDAAWTKNRKPGFQYLRKDLVRRLVLFAESGIAKKLYEQRYLRCDSKLNGTKDPLLYVPTQPAREMERDLTTAKILRWTPEGKIDFHAFRVAYITFVLEAGASAKEAQTMARHSTPNLTMNVYARTRENRLAELAEKVGEVAFPKKKCAHSVHARATGTDDLSANGLQAQGLQAVSHGGANRPQIKRAWANLTSSTRHPTYPRYAHLHYKPKRDKKYCQIKIAVALAFE